jgi:hypothetical protein
MPFTLQQLAGELTADPSGLGYAPLIGAGDRLGLAGKLNAVNQAIQIKRIDVAASEILEAVDVADFQTGASAPVAGALSWFESTTQQARLRLVNDDGTDTHIIKNLKGLFLPNGNAGANPQTRARLQAISLRAGSRAEQLWGAGTVISDQDIANAIG